MNGLSQADVIYIKTESGHIEEDCAARLARALGRTLVRVTAVLFNMTGRSLFTPCPDKVAGPSRYGENGSGWSDYSSNFSFCLRGF